MPLTISDENVQLCVMQARFAIDDFKFIEQTVPHSNFCASIQGLECVLDILKAHCKHEVLRPRKAPICHTVPAKGVISHGVALCHFVGKWAATNQGDGGGGFGWKQLRHTRKSPGIHGFTPAWGDINYV